MLVTGCISQWSKGMVPVNLKMHEVNEKAWTELLACLILAVRNRWWKDSWCMPRQSKHLLELILSLLDSPLKFLKKKSAQSLGGLQCQNSFSHFLSQIFFFTYLHSSGSSSQDLISNHISSISLEKSKLCNCKVYRYLCDLWHIVL